MILLFPPRVCSPDVCTPLLLNLPRTRFSCRLLSRGDKKLFPLSDISSPSVLSSVHLFLAASKLHSFFCLREIPGPPICHRRQSVAHQGHQGKNQKSLPALLRLLLCAQLSGKKGCHACMEIIEKYDLYSIFSMGKSCMG